MQVSGLNDLYLNLLGQESIETTNVTLGINVKDNFLSMSDFEIYQMISDKQEMLKQLVLMLDVAENLQSEKNIASTEKDLLIAATAMGLLQNMTVAAKQADERKMSRDYERKQSEASGYSAQALEDLSSLLLKIHPDYAGAVAVSTPTTAEATTPFPLPLAFYNVILLDYIPKQEVNLLTLAAALNYSNYGVQIIDPVLKAISSFSDAQSSYDLTGDILTLQKIILPIEMQEVKRRLLAEINQQQADKSCVTSAITLVDSILVQIPHNSNLIDNQKITLTTIFRNYLDNLQIISTQLDDVQAQLASIAIMASTGNTSFTVQSTNPGWYISLKNAEDVLINGNGTDTPGGMEIFIEKIIQDQQSLQDVSQMQQMALQLNLAGMSQQWTVVSTSLTVLNKMYRSLIEEVKG